MSVSNKYGIGSIVLAVLSYYWETALFGLFLGVAGGIFGYFSYLEAKKNNQSSGVGIFGLVISIIATIYNVGFL